MGTKGGSHMTGPEGCERKLGTPDFLSSLLPTDVGACLSGRKDGGRLCC
jgi:hypothetical protein